MNGLAVLSHLSATATTSSKQTASDDGYLASVPAALLDNDPAIAVHNTVYACEIVRHLGQECRVPARCAFPGIQVRKRRFPENVRFDSQNFEWLMKAGCSEFQSARERLSRLHVTPEVE